MKHSNSFLAYQDWCCSVNNTQDHLPREEQASGLSTLRKRDASQGEKHQMEDTQLFLSDLKGGKNML